MDPALLQVHGELIRVFLQHVADADADAPRAIGQVDPSLRALGFGEDLVGRDRRREPADAFVGAGLEDRGDPVRVRAGLEHREAGRPGRLLLQEGRLAVLPPSSAAQGGPEHRFPVHAPGEPEAGGGDHVVGLGDPGVAAPLVLVDDQFTLGRDVPVLAALQRSAPVRLSRVGDRVEDLQVRFSGVRVDVGDEGRSGVIGPLVPVLALDPEDGVHRSGSPLDEGLMDHRRTRRRCRPRPRGPETTHVSRCLRRSGARGRSLRRRG